ncbi:hypothetical protein HPB47_005582 [Ixodes persulcatus]|uniref:Uncharacterized protein n=1 Tax=Ixodes persulcatus TaxID=34615 RepID=A0AC60PCP8_IXOPE|nr:hypothetical protein HPB47_005582 [Ixodes persulcatus]
MNLDDFVSKHLELLELERDEEVEQNAKLQEKFSLKELQNKGLCITRLLLGSSRTGLYGRNICRFRSSHHGAPLPSHKFSSGDIAGVVVASDPGREVVCSGVVSSVSQTDVTVAFDEGRDALDGDDGRTFHLLKLANDVTYRRLRRTLEKLSKDKELRYSSLVEVLFGTSTPGENAESSSTPPLDFYNDNLDDSQREAVRFSLRQRELAVIHGPPGTGKTTTLVEVIQQCAKQGAKVLVCAPSNVAVDNLVERLSKSPLRIVRLGHPARLLPGIAKHSLDAILASTDDFGIVDDIRKEIDAIVSAASKNKAKDAYYKVQGKLSELRKELKERERKAMGRVLTNADVVLSTLTSASDDGPLRNLPRSHFEVAVVDECSQALEAACWMALLRAPKCILAGDHLQLPPTIVSETAAKGGLAVTLMERALVLYGDGIKRMLNMQYRMHGAIMKWSSDRLYEGRLVAHASVASHLLRDLPGVEDNDDTATPLLLIDTASCSMTELDTPDDESKGNEGEADLVAIHVERLISSGVDASNIAVISPYNLQVELIRLRLSSRHPGLEVRSVDGFQGREKEAVVMSLVRSNDAGNVGFLAEDRRINVAVTRARRHVAVICDTVTVSRHDFLKSLVDYLTSEGEVRSAREYSSDLELCSAVRPQGLRLNEEKKKPVKKPGAKSKTTTTHPATQQKGCVQRQKYPATGNGTRQHPQKPEDDVTLGRICKEVEAFVASGSTEQAFPATLTAYERRLVHEVAERFSLLHASEGDGEERHIVLRKRAEAKPSPNQPSSKALAEKTTSTKKSDPKEQRTTPRCPDETPESDDASAPSDESDSVEQSAAVAQAAKPKASVSLRKQKQKKHVAKAANGDSKDEDNFDELIASVMVADRTCTDPTCQEKLHTVLAGTGGPCPFCKRGYCFKHALPEAHGCGDEARAHARAAWLKSRGGTVAPPRLRPDKKAQVRKELSKQLAKMADSRKRQTKK